MTIAATMTDEQRGLQEAVRTLLAKRSDSAAARQAMDEPCGYDQQLWQIMVEQIGASALPVPERFGGLGAPGRETQIVMEELGRTLTPAPMLGSVLAAALLVGLDDDETSARLLPRIAAGTVVAVAWADEAGDWAAGACTASGDQLNGTAHYVLDGDTAELLLVVADGAVYEVAVSDVQRAHTPTMDRTRRLARITAESVRAVRIGPADARPALRKALNAATVALAGEQVGAAAAALQMTVDYAKARTQFGRPIGSFQALKHRMADLHVRLESARSAAYAAAAGELHPSAAKVYCSAALQAVAAETIQLHGGIAITWEHDAHLYLKRAHGSAALFGAAAGHLKRLETELT